MATAHDVAAYILKHRGPMSAMKMQKLVYYAQAWHLVWESESLFDERIEAWANGPVVYELYDKHRGQFKVSDWPWGDPGSLAHGEAESIDAVLDYYGNKPAHELSELTHREAPWRNAREGCPLGARSNAEITKAAMAEYYDGLVTPAE